MDALRFSGPEMSKDSLPGTVLKQKRTWNPQDEEDGIEPQCCSYSSSSRPMKSGKTQEKQSILYCTVHFQKYNQAVDLIENGSVREAIPILKSFLVDADHAHDQQSLLNPCHQNILIKASIKLATAYRILSLPKEALMTLNQVLLPNHRLYIPYTHNLFGEAAVVYAYAKDELTSQTRSKISSEIEFEILYVESCLCWIGCEFMKLGKFRPALMLFEASTREAKRHSNNAGFSSYPLKQLYVQAVLDLTQCHLAVGSLSKAKSVLETLRVAERSLGLNYNNPKFLKMINLTATIDSWHSDSVNGIVQSISKDIPGTYNGGVPHIHECCYQALCIPPGSSDKRIHSSFRTLSKIIHPDKGGETGLMQTLVLAYRTLRDPCTKEPYDRKCKAMHTNFENQAINQTAKTI